MKKILLASAALTIFAASIILFQISSCTKSVAQENKQTDTVYKCTPSIQGLWIGTQQSSTTGQPFSMSIKPDGTMTYENIVYNTQQLCVGTWTLVNSTFTCNTECIYGYFVGVKQKFTATFDASTGILSSGTWVDTYPATATSSGTFTLTKVN